MLAQQLELFDDVKPEYVAYVAQFCVDSHQDVFRKLAKKYGLIFREYLYEPPLARGTIYYRMGIDYDEAIVTVSNHTERVLIKEEILDVPITTYKIFQDGFSLVLTEFFEECNIKNLMLHSGKPEAKILASFSIENNEREAEYFSGFWPNPGLKPWSGKWRP